jgi:hypothetical protein
MKFFIFLITLQVISVFAKSTTFEADAKKLSATLKSSLVKKVTNVINEKGVEEAIGFCHGHVKEIAKEAGKDFIDRYKFGRTALRVRNPNNRPESWMITYLKDFANSKEGEKGSVVHQLPDGQRVYLDPIYIKPVCLQCHGQNVSKKTLQKIKSHYPKDEATGYKLGEFRGFVWVMDK